MNRRRSSKANISLTLMWARFTPTSLCSSELEWKISHSQLMESNCLAITHLFMLSSHQETLLSLHLRVSNRLLFSSSLLTLKGRVSRVCLPVQVYLLPNQECCWRMGRRTTISRRSQKQAVTHRNSMRKRTNLATIKMEVGIISSEAIIMIPHSIPR